MRIGLREANQRFSQAMKAVKKGEEVILTERGKPIAVIKPLHRATDVPAILQRLEAEGLLRPGPKSLKPMPVWRFPRSIKGKPISQTLRDERDQS